MRHITYERLQYLGETHTRARKMKIALCISTMSSTINTEANTCNEIGILPSVRNVKHTRDCVGWQVSVVIPFAKRFPETTKQVEKVEDGVI